MGRCVGLESLYLDDLFTIRISFALPGCRMPFYYDSRLTGVRTQPRMNHFSRPRRPPLGQCFSRATFLGLPALLMCFAHLNFHFIRSQPCLCLEGAL